VARYVAGRLVHIVLVLLVVSFALAFMLDLTPGDPAYSILGEQATAAQIAAVHKELHLDDSIPSRYGRWLGQIATGNFGKSYITKQSVWALIWQALPVTVELIVLALVMALALAIPIGIYTAYRADGRFDRLWVMICSTLAASPGFVTALILVYLFAVKLHTFPVHFPATGWIKLADNFSDNLWHAFLPALTMALSVVPQWSLTLRSDMIQTLQEDYILAARARGAPNRRILIRHALRPSSFSLLTLSGLTIGIMVSQAVILEPLFALPGLGYLLVTSVLAKDFPVVQGIVMFIAIAYVTVNVLIDVAYGYLDPRVRVRRV
jgi:peptide/nickel transport system permease protein